MPARELREYFFQRSGQSPGPQRGGSIEREQLPFVEDGHAVGEQFDFLHGVRGEEQRRIFPRKDFRFQEMPEIGGDDGVEAARRFIQQQHLRLMKQCAEQAESLDRAGGKRARLAVQSAAQSEPFAQGFDAAGAEFIGEVVQAAKELQILAAGEPRIEAEIASCVVPDLASHGCWFARGVVPGQRSGATRWQEQRGQNAKQRRFAGSIGTEQSDRLSLFYFQGDAA